MHCNSLQFMFSVDNYSYFMVILLYFKMHISPFSFYITKHSNAIIHTCLYRTENGQLFVLFLHNDFSIQDDRNHAPSPARAKCLVQTITLTG